MKIIFIEFLNVKLTKTFSSRRDPPTLPHSGQAADAGRESVPDDHEAEPGERPRGTQPGDVLRLQEQSDRPAGQFRALEPTGSGLDS